MNLDMPLLSVIVPIYNSEKYLANCIESILCQSYKNMEIVLVDDGSTDNSGNICDKYAQIDNRIYVVHKGNGGLVSARKAGLTVCRGDYVTFIDSDDWIDSLMVEEMVKTMLQYDCDIIQTGFMAENEDGTQQVVSGFYTGYFDLTDKKCPLFNDFFMKRNSYFERGVRCNTWSCLFKKTIIYPFQMNVPNAICNGEDDACFYPMVLNAKSFYKIEEPLYHFRIHPDSMSRCPSMFSMAEIDILDGLIRPEVKKHHACSVLLPQFNRYLFYRLNHHMHMAFGINYKFLYILPYELMTTAKKVVIHGAGAVGKSYALQCIESYNFKIVKWVDRKYGYTIFQHEIEDVSSIQQVDYDIILIAASNENVAAEMREDILHYNVEEKKILWVKPKRTDSIFYIDNSE